MEISQDLNMKCNCLRKIPSHFYVLLDVFSPYLCTKIGVSSLKNEKLNTITSLEKKIQ